MADIGSQDAVRAGLLDAIASGGKAAGAAYTQAQTGLQGQQADAIRAALSNSVASGLPADAQAQLSQTISQPYQNRIGQLTQNAATSQDYFSKLGASEDVFSRNVSGLVPALEAQYAAKSRGSGGGGGGGAPKLTQLELRGQIEQDARAAGGSDPWWLTAQKLAAQQGISSKDAQSWFQPSSDYTKAVTKGIPANLAAKARGVNRALTPGNFKNQAVQAGLDEAEATYLTKQYAAGYQQKWPAIYQRIIAGAKHPLQKPKKK